MTPRRCAGPSTKSHPSPKSHSTAPLTTAARCNAASARLIELQERTPALRWLWDRGHGSEADQAAYYHHWQEVRAQMALCDALRAQLVAEVKAGREPRTAEATP